MEIKLHLAVIAAFVAGLFVASVLSIIQPEITGFVVRDTLNLGEIPSPSDTLNESSFLLLNDRLIIRIDNASISSYSNTGSMLPFLTNYSHGLRIHPATEQDIHVGDVVSFNNNNKTIVHRVVRIENSNATTYFITRGDNSITEDRIEFKDIEWKIIGILY